jgi:hypothetical protein
MRSIQALAALALNVHTNAFQDGDNTGPIVPQP